LRALIWATLFLTFDLVLFGAFTRLSDSGLGCPDWPGCYGHASPFGAAGHIDAAASAQPTGPVTPQKAWIEMAHRYLATGVGALILLMAVLSWVAARRRQATGVSPAWAVATLFWVCMQGAFGALTVTSKLQPAIVTLHLLGGIGLLVLLAAQAANLQPRLNGASRSLVLGVGAVLILVLLQAALGGWVSSNYAVLACRDFPKCQGAWFPPADFAEGFHLWRPSALPREAVTCRSRRSRPFT
jgi:cytochrome c oxidase assembly protein subunit 15